MMPTQTLRELSKEITEWADKNFDYHHPALGVLEEVGELAHAVLKRNQAIRGQKNPAKFELDATDAVADATIYLLHWVGLTKSVLDGSNVGNVYNITEDDMIGHMAQRAGALIIRDSDDCKLPALQLLALLKTFSITVLKKDLLADCVIPTWEKVKLRNWRKFSGNGISE